MLAGFEGSRLLEILLLNSVIFLPDIGSEIALLNDGGNLTANEAGIVIPSLGNVPSLPPLDGVSLY